MFWMPMLASWKLLLARAAGSGFPHRNIKPKCLWSAAALGCGGNSGRWEQCQRTEFLKSTALARDAVSLTYISQPTTNIHHETTRQSSGDYRRLHGHWRRNSQIVCKRGCAAGAVLSRSGADRSSEAE